ncbi:MAG: YciI family protein [Ignavibacteriaceae bacterium]
MKHFIIIITYTAPIEEINKVVESHRAFLQKGYDSRLILMSGPQNPKSGGIVLARGKSKDELVNFFLEDPYKINQLAEYRFIEFNPVKHQPFLSDWCKE